MIDPLLTMRSYLADKSLITAQVSDRIYAGAVYPPSEYQPGQKAICFNGRGGQLDYHSQTLRDSLQFKCYGADEVAAMGLYRTLVDILHDGQDANIRSAQLEISGYPLREPETGWHYTLCYFTVWFKTGLGA